MKKKTIFLHGMCAFLTIIGWVLCATTGHELIRESREEESI